MGPLEIEQEFERNAEVGLILIRATTGVGPVLGEIAIMVSPGILKEGNGVELIPSPRPRVVTPERAPSVTVRRPPSGGGRARR
jgi:hypothetical protein